MFEVCIASGRQQLLRHKYKSVPRHREERVPTTLTRDSGSVLATMLALTALFPFALLPSALAHGGVLSYANAGNWYQGWNPYNSPTGQTGIQRPWSS